MLSSAYLYLFVQPLRETMRLNANQQKSWMAAGGVTVIVLSPKAHKHESARVAPASLYAPEGGASGPSSPIASLSPTSADGPAATPSAAATARSQSLALEVVMRRNAFAVAAAICSCVCHFTFSSTAMVIDEPHMRKLTMPVAFIVSAHVTQLQLHLVFATPPLCSFASLWLRVSIFVAVVSQDCTVMVGALCVVLKGGTKSAPAGVPVPTAVVQLGQQTRHRSSPSLASPSDAPTACVTTIADECSPTPELAAASPHSNKHTLTLQLQ